MKRAHNRTLCLTWQKRVQAQKDHLRAGRLPLPQHSLLQLMHRPTWDQMKREGERPQ